MHLVNEGFNCTFVGDLRTHGSKGKERESKRMNIVKVHKSCLSGRGEERDNQFREQRVT